ncbi:hypothetical protein G6F37_012056 [Rhizopus arrhizus]|nr:hypothetical protein G6F38_012087 [Rhizopus arrhizus]KAG1145955.1 hypothetical protein G6F37_012056 [Rhizopus arrhizus]
MSTTGTIASGYRIVSVKSSIDGIGWDNLSKRTSNNTVTDHYLHFVHKTLDEMDLFEEMKGFYLVMDNVFIHITNEISDMVTERGYKRFYPPPYSPELNPIRNF